MLKSMMEYFLALKLPSLLDFLNASPYDELIELNTAENSFRFLYNVEGKYDVPVTEGSLKDFVSHALLHSVYPDDASVYAAMMDVETLVSRLESAPIPGALNCCYRVKSSDGKWRWMEQFLIGTERFGLPENVLQCYVFDVQHIRGRETGATRVTASEYVRDSLTGLLYQKDFFSVAERTLRASPEKTWLMASIDVENFKMFNEWYGEDAGDQVLSQIGSGLFGIAEKVGGLAGYLGLDDFCLLIPEGSQSLESLYTMIHRDISSFGVSLGFMPAIGYAVSKDSISALNLYDRAALAAKHAKEDFKDRIRRFREEMFSQAAEDYRILSDFQLALKAGEISFDLQPQCRASTGQIVGAESLARWRKPDGTMVPPGVFVPVLEKYGFIPDLDSFIWDAVCRWLHELRARGLPLIPISLNVSQVDIFSLNVPEIFSGLIKTYDLPSSAVKIEITESACGDDSRQVHDAVSELRRRGFAVLMDDFGSGYSSLNMLSEMNFDVIKLDAQFLNPKTLSAEKGMHILESVVNMAKTIGVPIIVEGVEEADQRDYLQSLGCRYVQGYLFYKPMPPSSFEALLRQPELLDAGGFRLKANEQFRLREFLNDTVYSDAMLNSILGPVAIYEWDEDSGAVDIIRYNEQFYEAVNVPDFVDRLVDIRQYMPRQADVLEDLLREAYEDRLNGSNGILPFSRIDGGVMYFLMHFYYLNDNSGRKHFYGSARNVTRMRNLSNHMQLLGQYFSDCIVFLLQKPEGYTLQVVAQGMENVMQLDREALEAELNTGAFYDRVDPEDRARIHALFRAALEKHQPFTSQFSLSVGDGRQPRLFIKCDCVDDAYSDVRCIITIAPVPEDA